MHAWQTQLDGFPLLPWDRQVGFLRNKRVTAFSQLDGQKEPTLWERYQVGN
jgi:hypothetical protein